MRLLIVTLLTLAVLFAVPAFSTPVRADDYSARNDEYWAERMVDWMKSRGRKPNAQDLKRDSIKKMWNAYQHHKRREQEREREREEKRKAYQEWRAKKIEEQAKREYQAALNAFARSKTTKDFRPAIERFNKIRGNKAFSSYHGDAETNLKEINEIGMSELAEAKQLAEAAKYEEAFKRFGVVAMRFRGAPCGQEAAKAAAELRRDPTYLAKVKKDRAVNLLKRAEACLEAKDYVVAASLYEMLVRGYADLPEGKAATAKLEELKADKKLWALIEKQRDEAKAKSLWAQAQSYLKMGRGGLARTRLKELIEKYPKSEYAAKARPLLTTTTTAPAVTP